ncbi:MAG: methyltransferase domain-containing protein [Gammaproteobacteria bacterium]|nr:methyltransferase domain-containing protein [Gammaproteobacteria bacterium]
MRRRQPRSFREDFSGPASAACEWVRSQRGARAIGVDIEPAVIEWGRRHRLSRLPPEARKRVRLITADVLKVKTAPVDVVAALNFSYWVFKSRQTLLRYFRRVRKSLTAEGIFVLDAFGGHDAVRELKERTRHRGFAYVWEQVRYRPVTGEIECHIHFRFPDGSMIRSAFVYDWRLWTLPELRELLLEAGFRRATVYWEGDDGEGGGNGEFKPEEYGEADATWIAYVVAER